MTDKKRGGKTKYSLPQHWRSTAVALLVLFALIGGSCARYVLFVSQTVYRESTSHLSEILRKSDNMLNHLVSRNRMILHLWGGLLENASSEEQIRSSLNEMQKETGCAALYFLASDGRCMTQDGEKSSLGSQTDLDALIFAGEDVVVNAVLPGKPQMLVFACPEMSGIYRGFAYDAIAIAYYNDTVLNAIDNSAFEGTSHNYVVYPDGRVVLDSEADGENGSEESVYNFLAELRSSSNLSDKAFDALSDDFAQGRDGSKMLTLHGTRYYLVYENTGIQDWIMLSLVPVSVVNASMDTLWHRTVEIVTAIACLLMVLLIALIVHRSRDALRRRDTEILYRDELFTRLSRNVDDVFFMLMPKPPARTMSARTSSGCLACRSSRCGRTSVHCGRCTRRTLPTTIRTSSRGFSAASRANGMPIMPISRPVSAAGSTSSPWAARSQAGPSTSS